MQFRRLLGVAVVVAVVVLATACGDDSGGGAEPAAEDPVDSADTVDSTSSTTTAAIPEGGVSIEGVQLTAVVFGAEGAVTVTNTAADEAILDGLWLCNSSDCVALAGAVAGDESVDVAAAELGGLAAEGGEAALYSSDAFDSPDAMVDYVRWGAGGGRGDVAAAAGLWPDGVTVTPTAELIELFGVPGDPEAWS
jgi:hypothetical protein